MKNIQIIRTIPVSLFGAIMGLSGIAVAYRHFADHHAWGYILSHGAEALAILAFVGMLVLYGGKCIFHFDKVREEFTNPLTKSFFGTITISLLLVPIVIAPYAYNLAYWMWQVGVIGTFLFAIYMVNFWIETKHINTQLTPAWIIPVVGTLDIPLASSLFPSIYTPIINVTALSIGLFFAIPLLTLIFARVIFIEKLPYKLMPTLMILIAPFSVGHLAYMATYHQMDSFAYGLFALGIFLFLALLPQLAKLRKVCPFKVSWWAISFPVAGVVNSLYSIRKYIPEESIVFTTDCLLLLFSGIVIYLLYRTISGLMKQDFEPFS